MCTIQGITLTRWDRTPSARAAWGGCQNQALADAQRQASTQVAATARAVSGSHVASNHPAQNPQHRFRVSCSRGHKPGQMCRHLLPVSQHASARGPPAEVAAGLLQALLSKAPFAAQLRLFCLTNA